MREDIEQWNRMTVEEREEALNSSNGTYWYEVSKQGGAECSIPAWCTQESETGREFDDIDI